MITVNIISGKVNRIIGEEELRKFISNYDNAKDIFLQLLSWHNKGQKVFWAINPHIVEIDKKLEMLIGLDREELENTYYTLAEEI